MRKWFILTVSLCLLMTACQKPPEQTEPAQTQVTTQPAETTQPTEAPTEPSEPYTFCEDLRVGDSSYIYGVDSAAVLVETQCFDENGEPYYQLEVVELLTGTVLASRNVGFEFAVDNRGPEGMVLLVDYERDLFLLLDRELNDVDEIVVPEPFGMFTGDMTRYYYLQGLTLMELEAATGETKVVEAFAKQRFLSVNGIDGSVLLASLRTDPYDYTCADVALDVETGSILIMTDLDGDSSLQSNGVCCSIYNDGTKGIDQYYASFGDSQLRMLPGTLFGDEYDYSWNLRGTDYLYAEYFTDDGAHERTVIYRLGEELTACTLDKTVFPNGLSDIFCTEDGMLIACFSDGEANRVCRIDPSLMEFTYVTTPADSGVPLVDITIADRYTRILEENTLPEELSGLRARADALEETYGVTILLSGQCERPAGPCDFPITTTNYAFMDDEAAAIADALTCLEEVLALYPQDFFLQMRSQGEGLLILLVEDIQSDNNAIGVAYDMVGWYPIAVDITYWDMKGTFCHEIWHATESFILDQDYFAVYNGEWDALNPEGFEYSYDTTNDYWYYTDYTYIDGGWGKKSCFVDAYSRVDAKEDRARLMEYMMTNGEMADQLMTAPVLRAKMELISKMIRKVYNTDGPGWEAPWWERHITQGAG